MDVRGRGEVESLTGCLIGRLEMSILKIESSRRYILIVHGIWFRNCLYRTVDKYVVRHLLTVCRQGEVTTFAVYLWFWDTCKHVPCGVTWHARTILLFDGMSRSSSEESHE
jgi:hypothetical protein